MKNFVQKGENITVAAPAAVSSGAGVLVGALFGVANSDAAIGENLTLATVGVFELPKVTLDAIAVGAAVFWDDTAKKVTVTGPADGQIGHAVAAAANPSATVKVRLSI